VSPRRNKHCRSGNPATCRCDRESPHRFDIDLEQRATIRRMNLTIVQDGRPDGWFPAQPARAQVFTPKPREDGPVESPQELKRYSSICQAGRRHAARIARGFMSTTAMFHAGQRLDFFSLCSKSGARWNPESWQAIKSTGLIKFIEPTLGRMTRFTSITAMSS